VVHTPSCSVLCTSSCLHVSVINLNNNNNNNNQNHQRSHQVSICDLNVKEYILDNVQYNYVVATYNVCACIV